MTQVLPRLLLITTDESAAKLCAIVASALHARAEGNFAVMLRAPGLDDKERVAVAHELNAMCSTAKVRLIINGEYQLAQQLGLDIHLRESSPATSLIRTARGPETWVGRSCHDRAGVARAEAEAATYVTLGPVGVVPHKSSPLADADFSSVCHAAEVPVYALGGVTVETSRHWLGLGAHGIAIMRAWSESADPAETVAEYLRAVARP